MAKKTMFWAMLVTLMVFAGTIMAADLQKTAPAVEHKILNGSEPLPNAPYVPSQPGLITESPGVMVGETQYDYQSNGSSGHRVAVDSQGGVHFGWMNGLAYPTTRQIYYNYVSPGDVWLGPTQAGTVNLEGYNQLTVSPDDRGVLVYHRSGPNSAHFAIDTFSGIGIFDYFTMPNAFGSARLMWPYITRDRSGRYHVIMSESSAAGATQIVGYTRSSDGGSTWSALARVDTVRVIAPVVVSSPVSDKVAIVYSHFTDSTQWLNNIYYIQSADGTTWPWSNGKVNVTRYGGRDSLWAYTDLAAVYDYNDDLHIIWEAQWISSAGGIYYRTFLNHYDVTSGTITVMQAYPDSVWPSAGCDFGAWNRPICKMSLGVNQATNGLFATYTKFDTSDCSAGGFANGDIYLMYSASQGSSWSEEINLTDSHTPGCQPGDCDSDHWSSIAEKVDGFIHLFFVEDKDAGGIPQTEGTVTDNPVKYLKYPNPLLGVDEKIDQPKSFSLKQNYPNPFNAQTNIDFTLDKKSRVELAVYNLLGAKVATLANGQMEAGKHSINFDASKISSGIYYYTLKTDGSEVSKKMTLLK